MAIDGLVIDNYNNLTDKPIINQDLDGTFTATANSYYKHTGTTGATYTQGVVYFYDGMDFVAITGGGSGEGGVSDVKVNGTSVVADGVANIPAASDTTSGVVTTGTQTFLGKKTFKGAAYTETWSFRSKNGSYGFDIVCAGDNTPTIRGYTNFGLGAINIGDTSNPIESMHVNNGSRFYERLKGNWRLPNILAQGELMGKPAAYSSGSSGSLTITTAGEYEFYFVDSNEVRINIGSINIVASTASATGITTDYNQAYKLEVSAAGLVTLYNIVIGTSSTATTDTLYYRRKGI